MSVTVRTPAMVLINGDMSLYHRGITIWTSHVEKKPDTPGFRPTNTEIEYPPKFIKRYTYSAQFNSQSCSQEMVQNIFDAQHGIDMLTVGHLIRGAQSENLEALGLVHDDIKWRLPILQ